jgi:hypothetical protein
MLEVLITMSKNKNPKPQYPFVTKSQIKARIASDSDFATQCLCTLYASQTSHEQATKSTADRNHRGFMSSHAVTGSKLAEKVQAGDELTADEVVQVQGLVSHYAKQLASAARETAIAENPALAEVGKIYGIDA